MTHSAILFRDDARNKLASGATILADAVRVTLGPRARCVLIRRTWGHPIACDDGVTIAKEIHLEDPDEDVGAQLLREAAVRTSEVVGDGTTTSTLLAHALFTEGLRSVVAGANPVLLQQGIDRGIRAAVQAVRGASRVVASPREKAQVATISAHGDAGIGQLVADAMEKVGGEGAVSVEEAKGTETSLEVVDGMRFDRGLLSPYFVTDAEKAQAVLNEPYVLLCERRITTLAELLPLLEQVAKSGRSLLVIAEDVENEALATLVVNKLRGVLPCVAVKAPAFGDRRRDTLRDLEVLTGARLVSEQAGMKLESLTLADLGTARTVVVDRENTTLVGGGGTREAVQARCAQLRALVAEAKSDYDREKLEERLARLSGGVAVIRVGAPTEPEMKKRKESFDDAISATRAAMSEGVVVGGGAALVRAIPAVDAEARSADGDVRTGLRMVARALEAPLRQIARNAGADEGVVVARVREGGPTVGYDASSDRYVDLVEAGIIDAAKVVRVALENAASVAGVLLLAEATLTQREDPPREKAERLD